MQADLKSEPKADKTGKLWTPGAVDFFRIVNEQLQVTQTVSSGNLLLRSGQASLRVMRQFQVHLLSSHEGHTQCSEHQFDRTSEQHHTRTKYIES